MHRFKIYKIQMCKYALINKCDRGENCTFAHDINELRIKPDMRKTKLCKSYILGKCTDHSCIYAHSVNELREVGKPAICQLHREGRCIKGNQCRFAHSINDINTKLVQFYDCEENMISDINSVSNCDNSLSNISKGKRLILSNMKGYQNIRDNNSNFEIEYNMINKRNELLDVMLMENSSNSSVLSNNLAINNFVTKNVQNINRTNLVKTKPNNFASTIYINEKKNDINNQNGIIKNTKLSIINMSDNVKNGSFVENLNCVLQNSCESSSSNAQTGGRRNGGRQNNPVPTCVEKNETDSGLVNNISLLRQSINFQKKTPYNYVEEEDVINNNVEFKYSNTQNRINNNIIENYEHMNNLMDGNNYIKKNNLNYVNLCYNRFQDMSIETSPIQFDDIKNENKKKEKTYNYKLNKSYTNDYLLTSRENGTYDFDGYISSSNVDEKYENNLYLDLKNKKNNLSTQTNINYYEKKDLKNNDLYYSGFREICEFNLGSNNEGNSTHCVDTVGSMSIGNGFELHLKNVNDQDVHKERDEQNKIRETDYKINESCCGENVNEFLNNNKYSSKIMQNVSEVSTSNFVGNRFECEKDEERKCAELESITFDVSGNNITSSLKFPAFEKFVVSDKEEEKEIGNIGSGSNFKMDRIEGQVANNECFKESMIYKFGENKTEYLDTIKLGGLDKTIIRRNNMGGNKIKNNFIYRDEDKESRSSRNYFGTDKMVSNINLESSEKEYVEGDMCFKKYRSKWEEKKIENEDMNYYDGFEISMNKIPKTKNNTSVSKSVETSMNPHMIPYDKNKMKPFNNLSSNNNNRSKENSRDATNLLRGMINPIESPNKLINFDKKLGNMGEGNDVENEGRENNWDYMIRKFSDDQKEKKKEKKKKKKNDDSIEIGENGYSYLKREDMYDNYSVEKIDNEIENDIYNMNDIKKVVINSKIEHLGYLPFNKNVKKNVIENENYVSEFDCCRGGENFESKQNEIDSNVMTKDCKSFYDNNYSGVPMSILTRTHRDNNSASKTEGRKKSCLLIQNEEPNQWDQKCENVNNKNEKMNGSIIKGILSNFNEINNELLNPGKSICLDNKKKNINQINNVEVKNSSLTTSNVYKKDNGCPDFYNHEEGIYANEIFSPNPFFEVQRYFDSPWVYEKNEMENANTHNGNIVSSNNKHVSPTPYTQHNYKNKTNKQENNISFKANASINDEVFYGHMNQEYNMFLQNGNEVENLINDTNYLNNLYNTNQYNVNKGGDFWGQPNFFNYGIENNFDENNGSINETNNNKDTHFNNDFFLENKDFPLNDEEYSMNFCGDMVFNFVKNAE
ncbi:zinc finger protein, putative [Plasmodium vinckei vinckei]|uniref:Zinc finger protein, putative n=1 Tax=Plasmodium vinckei vinckei TaxID=54757 RepID=A0A449BNZ5_PLAVN|nr:zinc finger protein, putative [Plasmodium vinckei vinckei]VEV55155.1 zinc finger protein, putative [Plasmodium vinckei vinckei]